MKKHIIFTGSERTGKTLFAKMIFGSEKTAILKGRLFDLEKNHFPFDLCESSFRYETLIIDDVKPNFNFESLYASCFNNEMIINRRFREREVIKTPKFVITTNAPLKNSDLKDSFKRRFHVIDFDKDPISDLMKLIEEEKIIIKTHW